VGQSISEDAKMFFCNSVTFACAVGFGRVYKLQLPNDGQQNCNL